VNKKIMQIENKKLNHFENTAYRLLIIILTSKTSFLNKYHLVDEVFYSTVQYSIGYNTV